MTEVERDTELLPVPATLEGTLPKGLSESVLEAVGDAVLISKLAVGAFRDTELLPVPTTLEGTLPKGLSESVLEAVGDAVLISKLAVGAFRDTEPLPVPTTLEGTLPIGLSESVLEAVGDAVLISKLAVGAELLPVPATLEGTLPKGLSGRVLEAVELLSKLISGVGEALAALGSNPGLNVTVLLNRLWNETLLLVAICTAGIVVDTLPLSSIPVDGPGESGSVVVILIGDVSLLNTTIHDVFVFTVYVPSKHRSSRV
jgi:hypothetical protein